MKIEFPRNYLAAVALFMADQDMRFFLRGVFVEVLPDETRLVATDGACAGVARWPANNGAAAPLAVTIPRDVVCVVVARKKESKIVTLECSTVGDWSVDGLAFTPIEGTFPSYRRVIPASWSGQAGHYDPAIVQRFAKAGKALKLKGSPILRQNGDDGALVHFYNFDNFVGVLMPFRLFTVKYPDTGAPTWGPKC